LESVLGKPAMQALVQHFEIDRRADDPDWVHYSLVTIFGNGAVMLEKLIVREFYRRLSLLYPENASTFEFSKIIHHARESLRKPQGAMVQ